MKIGILSSGGDCPGINATIRGVGKTAIMHYGMEVIGIHSGFVGLLNKDVQTFDKRCGVVYGQVSVRVIELGRYDVGYFP